MNRVVQGVPATSPTDCKRCPVRSLALFQPIVEDQLDEVRKLRSEQIVIQPREHLYETGGYPLSSYTLFDGWLILYKLLESGERQILRFVLPGDFICFRPDPEIPVDHSAQALTPITVCAFPRDKLMETLVRLPELAMRVNQINAMELERYREYLTSVARKPAEARVAFLLLDLYIRQRRFYNDDDSVPLPATQESIADAMGLTTVHVNRVLQRLRQKGLIQCEKKHLVVHDIGELARVAQMDIRVYERQGLHL